MWSEASVLSALCNSVWLPEGPQSPPVARTAGILHCCLPPRSPGALPWNMAAALRSLSTGPAEGGSGGAASGSQCVAAVHAFYAAINRGDGDALAALLAEDVEWDCFEMPTSAQKVRQLRCRRRRRFAAPRPLRLPPQLPSQRNGMLHIHPVLFVLQSVAPCLPPYCRRMCPGCERRTGGPPCCATTRSFCRCWMARLWRLALASGPNRQGGSQLVETRGRQRVRCETKPFCCLR